MLALASDMFKKKLAKLKRVWKEKGGIRIDKQRFDGIFREICGFQHPEDGVQFDYEKITVVEIMEQRRYVGLQIKVPVSLGTMRQLALYLINKNTANGLPVPCKIPSPPPQTFHQEDYTERTD